MNIEEFKKIFMPLADKHLALNGYETLTAVAEVFALMPDQNFTGREVVLILTTSANQILADFGLTKEDLK